MKSAWISRLAGLWACAAACCTALGQPFDVSWYTIDGGGAMFTAGGDFESSGTIGQPDAGPQPPMIGGTYEVVGGFWVAATTVDACAGFTPADCDCDGDVDAFDIAAFVLALTNPAAYDVAYPGCTRLCVADGDHDGDVDSFDIKPFIDLLTGG